MRPSALWTALALVLVPAARCPPPRSRHANVVEQLLSQPEELVQASWSQVAAPFTANLNALKHDADLQSGGAQHSEAVPVVTASSAARKIANFVAHTENSSSSELGASALSLTRRCARADAGSIGRRPAWHTLSMFGNSLGIYALDTVIAAVRAAHSGSSSSIAAQISVLARAALSCVSIAHRLGSALSDAACRALTIAAAAAADVMHGSMTWLESMGDGDRSSESKKYLMDELDVKLRPKMEVDVLWQLQSDPQYVRVIRELGKSCDTFLCFLADRVEVVGCAGHNSHSALLSRLESDLAQPTVGAETPIGSNGESLLEQRVPPLPVLSEACVKHAVPILKSQMDDAALSKHSHVPTAGEKTVPFNERMLVAVMPTLGNAAVDGAARDIEHAIARLGSRRRAARWMSRPGAHRLLARMRSVVGRAQERAQRRLNRQFKRLKLKINKQGSRLRPQPRKVGQPPSKLRPSAAAREQQLLSISTTTATDNLMARAKRVARKRRRRRERDAVVPIEHAERVALSHVTGVKTQMLAMFFREDPKILTIMATMMAEIIAQMVKTVIIMVVMMVKWLIYYAIQFIPRIDLPNVGMAAAKGAAAKTMEITIKAMYKPMNTAKFNGKAAQMQSKTFKPPKEHFDKKPGVKWTKD